MRNTEVLVIREQRGHKEHKEGTKNTKIGAINLLLCDLRVYFVIFVS
jgi:hypothetical protein